MQIILFSWKEATLALLPAQGFTAAAAETGRQALRADFRAYLGPPVAKMVPGACLHRQGDWVEFSLKHEISYSPGALPASL